MILYYTDQILVSDISICPGVLLGDSSKGLHVFGLNEVSSVHARMNVFNVRRRHLM